MSTSLTRTTSTTLSNLLSGDVVSGSFSNIGFLKRMVAAKSFNKFCKSQFESILLVKEVRNISIYVIGNISIRWIGKYLRFNKVCKMIRELGFVMVTKLESVLFAAFHREKIVFCNSMTRSQWHFGYLQGWQQFKQFQVHTAKDTKKRVEWPWPATREAWF